MLLRYLSYWCIAIPITAPTYTQNLARRREANHLQTNGGKYYLRIFAYITVFIRILGSR